jgi:hypothetical protein
LHSKHQPKESVAYWTGKNNEVKSLASQIERELQVGEWKHCAVYEDKLKRFWPLDEEDREAKIAEFAKTYGLRLRFYQKGLCAIFDKCPKGVRRQHQRVGGGSIAFEDVSSLLW